jgi:hypothetical protein
MDMCCSTGEDSDGETRPKSRGLRGCGPSHRGWRTMAAVEESGGVPSFLVTIGGREASREGGGGENAARKCGRGGQGEKRGTGGAFYGGPVARQRERGKGSEVEGGPGGELRPRSAGRRWRGGGPVGGRSRARRRWVEQRGDRGVA